MSWNNLPPEIHVLVLQNLLTPMVQLACRGADHDSLKNIPSYILVCKQWQAIIIFDLVKRIPTDEVLRFMIESVAFRAIKQRLDSPAQESTTGLVTGTSSRDATSTKAESQVDVKNLWLDRVIQRGFQSCVKLLLDAGADINERKANDEQIMPIQVALRWEDYSIAKILLYYGPDLVGNSLHRSRTTGTDLLLAAVNHDDEPTVEKLLDYGVPLNFSNRYDSPLCAAVLRQNIALAKLFLSKGASLTNGANPWITPLFAAAQNGNMEILLLLLDKGANVNGKCRNGDALLASILKSTDVARFLIEKGAKVTVKHVRLAARHYPSPIPLSFIDFLIDQAKDLSEFSEFAEAALGAAVGVGQERLVKILRKRGIETKTSEDTVLTSWGYRNGASRGYRNRA